jgi:alkaline phosphatase D
LTFENPHLKYVELTKKGFVIIDVTPQKTQADWYYVNTIDLMNLANSCQKSFYTLSGSNSLVSSNTPSVGHGAFQINLMNECGRLASLNSNDNLVVVGIYPNPTYDEFIIQLINNSQVSKGNWSIIDQNGKLQTIQPLISVVSSNQTFLKFNLTGFKSGTYFIINDELKLKVIKN